MYFLISQFPSTKGAQGLESLGPTGGGGSDGPPKKLWDNRISPYLEGNRGGAAENFYMLFTSGFPTQHYLIDSHHMNSAALSELPQPITALLFSYYSAIFEI